jgi:DNA-binding winged helix-turn-helix (wHTH) protein
VAEYPRLGALSSWSPHETLNSSQGAVRVVFGTCEFDSLRHALLRHGRPVPLSPRAFRLLELLLDRRPEVVSKAELLERLWPATFVSDAGLHNIVAEVRAAIGDTPRDARYIRTVPRCGYAFHGEARPAPASTVDRSRSGHDGPFLVSPHQEWPLAEGPNDVGRDRDCPVSIDSAGVSRRHARIVVAGGAATVEDLGSKNGTFVNGQRVNEATPIEDGSQIQVGSVTMRYRRPKVLFTTVTQPPSRSS